MYDFYYKYINNNEMIVDKYITETKMIISNDSKPVKSKSIVLQVVSGILITMVIIAIFKLLLFFIAAGTLFSGL